jgi:hypothetical protein
MLQGQRTALFSDFFNWIGCTASQIVGCIMNWRPCRRKRSWYTLRYYPSFCVEWLEKTMTPPSKDNRIPEQDSISSMLIIRLFRIRWSTCSLTSIGWYNGRTPRPRIVNIRPPALLGITSHSQTLLWLSPFWNVILAWISHSLTTEIGSQIVLSIIKRLRKSTRCKWRKVT